MNPIHEHCSSQIFSKKKCVLIIKLNKNKIKLDKIFKNKIFENKIFVENNVLNA